MMQASHNGLGWDVPIVWCSFLSGLAGGAYAVAALARLLGGVESRRATRGGLYLGLPLYAMSGIVLISGSSRSEWPWDALTRDESWRQVFQVGSWGVLAFGAFSLTSFVGVLVEDGWLGFQRLPVSTGRLRLRPVGRLFSLGGVVAGFCLGSYTGAPPGATDPPIWPDTTWLAPLFLSASVSTGLAAILLLLCRRPLAARSYVMRRLEWLNSWAIGTELLLLALAAWALDERAIPAFGAWPGLLIPGFVVPGGLILPLVIMAGFGRRGTPVAAALVLVGGLVLRAALFGIPPALLAARG